MLKITDYGLCEFKSGAEPDADMSEHTFYQSKKLLYTHTHYSIWELLLRFPGVASLRCFVDKMFKDNSHLPD